MSSTRWDRRFFATTRGQVLQQLRHGPQTVDELARVLDLTDNAIRAHLATLERDGLVYEAGWRRTPNSRKPSQVYQLTLEADRLFPKIYSHVLHRLLGVLSERLARKDLEAALREVGRRLASDIGVGERPTGNVSTRLEIAASALSELGGLAEVVEADGGYFIHGSDCPLAAVIPAHEEVCLLTETFISSVSGLTVCQRCDRTGAPRCHFDVVAQ